MIYSPTFQRLSGVTQVASPHLAAGMHSRLTHSLKVAQVARRLAERLKNDPATASIPEVIELDVDAVETASLCHDLGHPPFGHLAEVKLNECASDVGGFEGNAQSFRIVTQLAVHHLNIPGLNLTRNSLNYMQKYPWFRNQHDDKRNKKWGAYRGDGDEAAFEWVRDQMPEGKRALGAEIMDWADDVTYAVHDAEDFFRAGVVPLDRLSTVEAERNALIDGMFKDGTDRKELRRGLALDIAPATGQVTTKMIENATHGVFRLMNILAPYNGSRGHRAALRATMGGLVGRYCRAFNVDPTPDGVEVRIAPNVRAQVMALKQVTWRYVIDRPSLALVQEGQSRIVQDIFDAHWQAVDKHDSTKMLPPFDAERVRVAKTDHGRMRAIVDYVAGLSEAQIMSEHRKLTGDTLGATLYEAQ